MYIVFKSILTFYYIKFNFGETIMFLGHFLVINLRTKKKKTKRNCPKTITHFRFLCDILVSSCRCNNINKVSVTRKKIKNAKKKN